MAQFPFIGSSYASRAGRISERCINLHLEAKPDGKMGLRGTPGQRLWQAFAGPGGVRNMLRFSATLAIIVVGQKVYSVTTAGVGTLIGIISLALTPVSMASNGAIIMLVTGQLNDGYFINPTLGTVTAIIDPDFHGANSVVFEDGYFVFDWLNTSKYQISQLYGSDIDGLTFASAEGSPDLLITILADHRELWLFGENTIEVHFNSGNSDFPFERIQGAFMETGIAAKCSAAKADNTVYWLSANESGQGIVQRAEGYTPKRCSDHGVENAISEMVRIDDAIGYTYQQAGHWFYVLNFPTAEQTWVFNIAVQKWHQRAWRNPATNEYLRHRSQCHIAFAGKNLVGDWENGNVYVLDPNYYTDNGDLIPRVRRCPHQQHPDYRRLFFSSLQIDMQPGVGLTTGQGSDPQIMLRVSDDGGSTFKVERWKSFGKVGEYDVRAYWAKLGSTDNLRVYETIITDPVEVFLLGASSIAHV